MEQKTSKAKAPHSPDKPEWLVDISKKFAIINAINEAFDSNCDCRCCQILRRYATDFKELFTPPQTPTP